MISNARKAIKPTIPDISKKAVFKLCLYAFFSLVKTLKLFFLKKKRGKDMVSDIATRKSPKNSTIVSALSGWLCKRILDHNHQKNVLISISV